MAAPFAAASLGAKIIEKHFTLSKLMYGSDAKHSMEPAEFKTMVGGIREIEHMLSNPVDKNQIASDLKNMKLIFEKSIVANCSIKKGEVFTSSNLTVKKPSNGIPATKFHDILGKKARYDMQEDYVITENSYYE
jgi:N-acetylneuraminate synthase